MWLYALSRLLSRLPTIGFLAVASLSAVFLATHLPVSSPSAGPRERTRLMEWASEGESALLGAGTYDWRFLHIPGATFTDAGSGTCHGAPA